MNPPPSVQLIAAVAAFFMSILVSILVIEKRQ